MDKGDFATPNYNNGGLNVDMTPYPYALELPSIYYVMNRDGSSFISGTQQVQKMPIL